MSAIAAGQAGVLHGADQGLVEPEVPRSRRQARGHKRRTADRRQLDQRRRTGRGDDHRGAAQHDLRAKPGAQRVNGRRARRSALPARHVSRAGLGRSDHPSTDAVRLVCLSATVSNAAELAEWISTVRGPTTAIVEDRRPVKLDNLYLIGDKTHERMHLLPTLVNGRMNSDAARLDEEAARSVEGKSTETWRGAGATTVVHAVAARSRRPVGATSDVAGDLLHLQPQPMRRGRQSRARGRYHG